VLIGLFAIVLVLVVVLVLERAVLSDNALEPNWIREEQISGTPKTLSRKNAASRTRTTTIGISRSFLSYGITLFQNR
jgi:hypothetical protein